MSATRAMVPDATMTMRARFLNTFKAGPVMAETINPLYRSGADDTTALRSFSARVDSPTTISIISKPPAIKTTAATAKATLRWCGLRWQGMPLQLRADSLPPADCASYSGRCPEPDGRASSSLADRSSGILIG
jgi:hypothetical protein